MNYRYVPDADGVLRAIAERCPDLDLHALWNSHPTFKSMSLDHLSLRWEQVNRSQNPSWQK